MGMTVDRCRSCAHPLAEGEWSRCDAECRHGPSLGDTWNPVTGVSGARGRARAEERDCPECDIDAADVDACCPVCDGFGRVRPLLCQACERSET